MKIEVGDIVYIKINEDFVLVKVIEVNFVRNKFYNMMVKALPNQGYLRFTFPVYEGEWIDLENIEKF